MIENHTRGCNYCSSEAKTERTGVALCTRCSLVWDAARGRPAVRRDKGKVYLCPKCDEHGFGWDGRAKVWMCHWVSCSHTEKHVDPEEDQVRTLFEAMRYLVKNTPPQPSFFGANHRQEQKRLVEELGEIIKLGSE